MDKLKRKASGLLKKFYGYSSFLPLQYEVIKCVIEGNDAVVLMPTGGGKSICFQIPALLMEGCTIVVSPLLALMKDQVDTLQSHGIPAAAINSNQSEQFNREVAEQVFAGRIKLLYISPERLLAELDSWSASMKISLIAIDEAHCISQWGHDFRIEYTRLSILKSRFPNVPIMALTATADRLTRDDIVKQLSIPYAKLFITSFDRKNISLRVVRNMSGNDKFRMMVKFIESHKGDSGIIYCMRRADTEKLAAKLLQIGYNAAAYHAGLDTDIKEKVQTDFLNDDLQIVCATVAFGMGINKSNVRWVIHNNMPKNMECYYQEIGRAGRDGMPAEAIMFYSFSDVAALMNLAKQSSNADVETDKIRRMQQYAESSVCRRRILLSYFNERFDHDCGNCDVCMDPPERFDGTQLCQMAMSAIVRVGEKENFSTIIDILKGSTKTEIIKKGYNHLKTYGVGRNLNFAQWNAYLLQMLQMGLIDVAYEHGNHLRVTEYGWEVLKSQKTAQLSRFYYDNHTVARNIEKKEDSIMSASDKLLFDSLKELRRDIAHKLHMPPYMVFSDKVLEAIAINRPTSKAMFSLLPGIGEKKTETFWKPFTDMVNEFTTYGE